MSTVRIRDDVSGWKLLTVTAHLGTVLHFALGSLMHCFFQEVVTVLRHGEYCSCRPALRVGHTLHTGVPLALQYVEARQTTTRIRLEFGSCL